MCPSLLTSLTPHQPTSGPRRHALPTQHDWRGACAAGPWPSAADATSATWPGRPPRHTSSGGAPPGPTIWPLVIALALHNGGILLRLGSEVIDNRSSRAAEVLVAQGATRSGIFTGSLLPESFNRFLLLLFYRWETCIREATVLGMLGVLSLGSLIDDANTRLFYDDMLLYVLLGALLVFAGDVVSDLLRLRLKGGLVRKGAVHLF